MSTDLKCDLLDLRAAALDTAQEALEAQAAQQKRLAEAVPDLLAAAKEALIGLVAAENNRVARRAENMLRKAIAKAEGA